MSEGKKIVDVKNMFDNIDDLPMALQIQIKLFRAKISERQIYREQLQEIQSSPNE
jgi:small-conductance mechanosensitive channel